MVGLVDLFEPVLPTGKLHPGFASLLRSGFHGDARNFINAAFARMGDPNGHFASQFQGFGFHGRLFEIACFAYLEAAGLAPSRPFDAPDFMVSKDGIEVAVEVMTANPPDGADRDISVARLEDLPFARVLEKTAVEFPRRMEASLKKKASRGYEADSHVAGKPLVLMTQPAYEAGASLYIDDALSPCLFGKGQDLPGFFARKNARAISAIAYCNGFAVSKFWRLSSPRLFRTSVHATRKGACLLPEHGDRGKPMAFNFTVGDPAAPEETWWEGVTLFLNPNASSPLPANYMPATCIIFRANDGSIKKVVNGFHPLTSFMLAQVKGP